MIAKRIVLILALLVLSTSILACHRRVVPPRDAKVISEAEIKTDNTTTNKANPTGGGGTKLNGNQW